MTGAIGLFGCWAVGYALLWLLDKYKWWPPRQREPSAEELAAREVRKEALRRAIEIDRARRWVIERPCPDRPGVRLYLTPYVPFRRPWPTWVIERRAAWVISDEDYAKGIMKDLAEFGYDGHKHKLLRCGKGGWRLLRNGGDTVRVTQPRSLSRHSNSATCTCTCRVLVGPFLMSVWPTDRYPHGPRLDRGSVARRFTPRDRAGRRPLGTAEAPISI